jgi:hypothetical protein
MPFDSRTSLSPDLARLDAAIALIDTPEKWRKKALETADGGRCIMGALYSAEATSLAPRIRAAIKAETGVDYGRRVEKFNDRRCTTHADVMRVMRRARADLIAGIAIPREAPVPAERVLMRLKKALGLQ